MDTRTFDYIYINKTLVINAIKLKTKFFRSKKSYLKICFKMNKLIKNIVLLLFSDATM